MKKINLKKKEKDGLKWWLETLEDGFKECECPWLSDNQTKCIQNRNKCKAMFLRTREAFANGEYETHCPCNLYPLDYVKRKARKVLKDGYIEVKGAGNGKKSIRH